MKKSVFLFIFLVFSVSLAFSQYDQTVYFDDGYGNTVELSLEFDVGTYMYTVTLYGQTESFTIAEVSDGTLQAWVEQVAEDYYGTGSSDSSGGSGSFGSPGVKISGGSLGVAQLRNVIGNSRLQTGKLRVRQKDDDDASNDTGSRKSFFSIVPDVSYLMLNEDSDLLHVGGSMQFGKEGKNPNEYIIRIWGDIERFEEEIVANGINVGLDLAYNGTLSIGNFLELGFGENVSLVGIGFSEDDYSEAQDLMVISATQVNASLILGSSLLLNVGGAYVYTSSLETASETASLLNGVSIALALGRNAFISTYSMTSLPFLADGEPVFLNMLDYDSDFTYNLDLDTGLTLGLYVTDSFFLEATAQVMMNTANTEDVIVGLSLGSSYRF